MLLKTIDYHNNPKWTYKTWDIYFLNRIKYKLTEHRQEENKQIKMINNMMLVKKHAHFKIKINILDNGYKIKYMGMVYINSLKINYNIEDTLKMES